MPSIWTGDWGGDWLGDWTGQVDGGPRVVYAALNVAGVGAAQFGAITEGGPVAVVVGGRWKQWQPAASPRADWREQRRRRDEEIVAAMAA